MRGDPSAVPARFQRAFCLFRLRASWARLCEILPRIAPRLGLGASTMPPRVSGRRGRVRAVLARGWRRRPAKPLGSAGTAGNPQQHHDDQPHLRRPCHGVPSCRDVVRVVRLRGSSDRSDPSPLCIPSASRNATSGRFDRRPVPASDITRRSRTDFAIEPFRRIVKRDPDTRRGIPQLGSSCCAAAVDCELVAVANMFALSNTELTFASRRADGRRF